MVYQFHGLSTYGRFGEVRYRFHDFSPWHAQSERNPGVDISIANQYCGLSTHERFQEMRYRFYEFHSIACTIRESTRDISLSCMEISAR